MLLWSVHYCGDDGLFAPIPSARCTENDSDGPECWKRLRILQPDRDIATKLENRGETSMEKSRIRPVPAGKSVRMSYSRQKEVLRDAQPDRDSERLLSVVLR